VSSRWNRALILDTHAFIQAFANIRNHYGIPHPEGYLPDVDPVNPADEPKEGSQSGQA
jgi:hypothetical protein